MIFFSIWRKVFSYTLTSVKAVLFSSMYVAAFFLTSNLQPRHLPPPPSPCEGQGQLSRRRCFTGSCTPSATVAAARRRLQAVYVSAARRQTTTKASNTLNSDPLCLLPARKLADGGCAAHASSFARAARTRETALLSPSPFEPLLHPVSPDEGFV